MSLLLSSPNSYTHSHLVTFAAPPPSSTTHLPSPSPLHCDRRIFSQRSQHGAHHLYGNDNDNGNGINPGRRRGCVVRANTEEAGPSSVVLDERLKTPAASCSVASWEAFSDQVSGEWDGYEAEFNFQGEPVQLPSAVVPDAFREWEVEVHDWQTQCPTLAQPEKGKLWYKVIRLLPTVGCEADAATTYSVEESDAQHNASELAYQKDGSYTVVWRGQRVTNEKKGSGSGKVVTREGEGLEVEQCLVHGRKRVRVLQQLGAGRRIRVFKEVWEGPFRNGESLGGCAATTSAFATQDPLQASSLWGAWHAEHYSTQFQSEAGEIHPCVSSELRSTREEDVERQLGMATIFLPKDMWTCLKISDAGGSFLETGWLAQPDFAVVSTCEFSSSGALLGVQLRLEQRT